MPVSAQEKKKFQQEVAQPIRQKIKEIEKEIATLQKAMKKNEKLAPFFRFAIIGKLLEKANLQIDLAEASWKQIQVRNSSLLDQARKDIYQIFKHLEEIVTLEIDEPLTFNRDKLIKIRPFTPRHRLNLYKHLRRTIERLIQAYGEKTKWKWSFPELWLKLAVSGKNLFDFREFQAVRDPREEFFYDRQELLKIIKEDLFEASNQYRDKFELATKSDKDLVDAIHLLEALKRIAGATGDEELVKKCKAGIEAYRSRLEALEKEKKKKKK